MGSAIDRHLEEGGPDAEITTTEQLRNAIQISMNTQITKNGKVVDRKKETIVTVIDVPDVPMKKVTYIPGDYANCHYFKANPDGSVTYKRYPWSEEEHNTGPLSYQIVPVTAAYKKAPEAIQEKIELQSKITVIDKQIYKQNRELYWKLDFNTKLSQLGLQPLKWKEHDADTLSRSLATALAEDACNCRYFLGFVSLVNLNLLFVIICGSIRVNYVLMCSALLLVRLYF